MVPALLLAATLSANPAAPAIGRDGRVDAPEGFRARLPAGHRYSVAEEDGRTLYRAVDPAGKGFVTVTLATSESALECAGAGAREVEAQPGVRVKVAPLRTRAGLEGCLVRGRNERGAMAVAFVPGTDGDVVTIAAVAVGADTAERQARAVAESVAFAPRPEVDPRLLGCFTRERSTSVPGLGGGAPAFVGASWTTRCFLPGRRFVEKGGLSAGAARRVSADAQGRWTYRAGRVDVETEEEAWRAAVGFDEGDLLLDGERWSREADPEPELEDEAE